jgi:hypothetical protein
MATFSDAKNALNDISVRIQQERARAAQGKKNYQDAEAVLVAMPTQYGEIMAAIDAAPATAPYTQLKAEKTALVSEFTTLRNEVTATLAAINGD